MKSYIFPYLILLIITAVYSCKKEDPINYDDIFNVMINNKRLLADDKATAEITLEVFKPDDVAEGKTGVKFSIAPIGTFHDGTQEFTSNIDIDGKARAIIKSSEAGLAYITITVGAVYTRTLEIEFYTETKDTAIYSFSIETDSVPSDNYHSIVLVAEVNDKELLGKNTSVTFNADDGTFPDGNKQYSSKVDATTGIAKAFLKHSKPGIVKVSLTTNDGNLYERSAYFNKAYPESININAQSAVLDATFGATTNIMANLSRSTGTVSGTHDVTFYDSIPGGFKDSIGRFFNIVQSPTQTTSDYSLQDTSYHGYVYIIGKAGSAKGDTVKGINRIYIK